jgi:hypothetical protein
MNDVFIHQDHQGQEEAGRHACVAEDLSKVLAWQLKADARIGQPVEIFGREFAGLWEALSYSVHQAGDKTADEILQLKSKIKEKEAEERALKERVNAWTLDVNNSFLNVKAHCDAVVEELRQVKEELNKRQTAEPGDGTLPVGAGRIQHGVLFPPRRNPEDEPTEDYTNLLTEMTSLRTRITKVGWLEWLAMEEEVMCLQVLVEWDSLVLKTSPRGMSRVAWVITSGSSMMPTHCSRSRGRNTSTLTITWPR